MTSEPIEFDVVATIRVVLPSSTSGVDERDRIREAVEQALRSVPGYVPGVGGVSVNLGNEIPRAARKVAPSPGS